MKRNIGVVLAVTILVGSMVVAVVPAEPAFAVPGDGDTVCGDAGGGDAPTFTVTNGVVSAGGDCTGAVVIPEGVTEIGAEAFIGSDLTSVVIPASVTSIGRGAFRNTGDLTTASFAEGSRLETIGVDAFMSSGLTSVAIPATVTAIGQSAFRDTASLATVTFAPDSRLGAIAVAAFQRNSALKNIVIPPSVTVIANSAFFNSGLTSVVIPASVTSIEVLAFESSSDLISITFLGNAPEQVGNAFSDLADDATAFVGFDATGFDLQDGLWNGLRVVRANPPAGAGAAPSPSAVSPALHLDARFRVGELAANQTVLAEGQGLQPHSAFSLTLRSTPQTLADGVANGGGLFSTVVSVPSDIPAGFHTITLNATGVGGELLTLVSGFTVDERGVVTSVTSSVSPPSRQLAETGPAHDVLTAVAFAGGLALLVGIVLVGARRVLVRV